MGVENGPGLDLLKQKYDLHNSPEVESAAKRTERRTGEKLPQNPGDQIQNYLDRFKEITERENPEERERLLGALKNILVEKYVTKKEDISQNYGLFLEEVIEERGQRGDWDAASDKEKQEMITDQSEAALSDQRDSLEVWLDYLTSSDAPYPDWLKYWSFRSIVGLSEYNKEQKKFPKRSKGTVKMFPDLNQEALGYVMDTVEQKYQGKTSEIPYDIQENERNQFQKFLENENFANLYAWAIENIHPIDEGLLKITDGKWVKYHHGSNPVSLVQSIRGKGTGWCTAGETTAKKQLQMGDFYTFYSLDTENNPTIPRIAIRKEGTKIAEVRGIAYKQNLDPYMGDVLAQKLQEFPDKDEYLKKERDMSHLTAIKNKTKQGEGLNKEDLVFLYEIDSKIQGFGYQRDPRIEEIRSQRDPKVDVPILLNYQPTEIACDQTEVNKNTKAYVGTLYPGIFEQLNNLDQIYTKFPEGKISHSQLKVGGKSAQKLENELKREDINIVAEQTLHSPEFTTLSNSERLELIKLKIKDLGFTSSPTLVQIYDRANELGLDLCPPEVAIYQLLRDDKQSLNRHMIAMKPIMDRRGNQQILGVDNVKNELYLYEQGSNAETKWSLNGELVFQLRKNSRES